MISLNSPYLLSSEAIESVLKKNLEHLFRQGALINENESLTVRLICPDNDEADFCIKTNHTLYATIKISWSTHPEHLTIKIPYPSDGVFIIRSATSDNNKAGRWVWHPRLTGKCGGRRLLTHKYEQGRPITGSVYRVDFPCLKYIEIPFDPDTETISDKYRIKNGNYIIPFWDNEIISGRGDSFFELLKPEFPFYVMPVTKRTPEEKFEFLTRCMKKVLTSNNKKEMDGQDISWQRLYTYSAYLIEFLLERFVKHFYSIVSRVHKKSGTLTEDTQIIWESLLKMDEYLIPVSKLIKTGWLHFFSPINGIEALSKLMSFQRYDYKKDVLERLPAVFRQSHPSFQGLICPVESPESLKVGITLHLAKDVKTDVLGNINAPPASSHADGLGYAASLVPFYQFNDGARAMMGAKNLKQTAIINGAETPAIKTGYEKAVTVKISSLVKNKILKKECESPLGTDLLVAYMPWYGWNMEDAIVANSRLVDQGTFDWKREENYFKYLKPGVELAEPVFNNKFEKAFQNIFYDERGIRKPGWIKPGNPIAFFRDKKTDKIIPFDCKADIPSDLVAVNYHPASSRHFGGSLAWTLRQYSQLKTGDKIMGRYGNKGVISKIIPPDAMPRLPRDERLPVELQGRAVDLILNPHGVISRMNLGQLIETSAGLVKRLYKNDKNIQNLSAEAFSSFDYGILRHAFLNMNQGSGPDLFDNNGRIHLVMPDGRKTRSPVAAGFQYFVRLKHTAENKYQARSGAGTGSQSCQYNLVTGQPVGGRRRKGGQRLGEMEIWALAAYQADSILKEVLTHKSDPGYLNPKIPHGQTFQSILDHLYAMGIDFQCTGEKKGQFSWVTPESIKRKGERVLEAATWQIGMKGLCCCDKPDCKYHIKKPLLVTGKSGRAGRYTPTVNDFFLSENFMIDPDKGQEIPPFSGKSESASILIYLKPLSKGKNKRRIKISYKRSKRSVQIDFKMGRAQFHAYKQNDTPDKTISYKDIGALWISCATHKTRPLSLKSVTPLPVAVKGGLCDQKIFGDLNLQEWNPDSWGYIELQQAVSFPDKKKSGKGILKNSSKFDKTTTPPDLTCIPVLPLKYRYRGSSKNSSSSLPQNDQLTEKYLQLVKLSSEKQDTQIKQKILKTVNDIFKLIYSRLFGKSGLLRRNGLGRRVDMSGRLVIVPDPNLAWDECGVPAGVLMQFTGDKIGKKPYLLDEFAKDKPVDNIIKYLFNVDRVFEGIPQRIETEVLDRNFWLNPTWPDKHMEEEHLRAVEKVLERYLEEHPDLTLILNRQPSLHRYSIMGFKPVVLSPDEGQVLKINPLVCKGFGADFDGDEMAVHMPMECNAQLEAQMMKPTRHENQFSFANQQVMANFDQDFVAGHFYISLDTDARENLKSVFRPLLCSQCLQILDEEGMWKKNHGEMLLSHLCHDHPDKAPQIIMEWMQLAFKQITEEGLSFSILELETLHKLLKPDSTIFLQDCNNIVDEEMLSEKTSDLGNNCLDRLSCIIDGPSSSTGFGLVALAASGARGTKQIRQLVGSRGYLDPGHTGFTKQSNHFLIKESLVEGMTKKSSFWASMNSRSSMLDKKLGTGRAGYLTRQLVLAGWDWVVTKGDCGADRNGDPGLIQCRWKAERTVCSECYGKLPHIKEVPEGFPAGLIAAQSFGERGTQLSMQSFHTAEKQLSVDEVVALLNGKDPVPGHKKNPPYNWFLQEQDAELFVKRIKRENGYKNIDKRHIQLIWLIIHMSDRKSLSDAWHATCSPLASLIGPKQWKSLLSALNRDKEEIFSSPFAKIMMSRSPVVLTQQGSKNGTK